MPRRVFDNNNIEVGVALVESVNHLPGLVGRLTVRYDDFHLVPRVGLIVEGLQ